MIWKDISSEYAGHFFWVLGGNFSEFGLTQNDNSPRITNVRRQDNSRYPGSIQYLYTEINYDTGLYSKEISTGGPGIHTFYGLQFYATGGEVRPLNKTVKVWKRIK